ncbi:hypothetical protein G6F21_014343 [Rhizopus arrhizus]|nr:hypothetical protein G6F21_014343 [Rhizopus arrhizus]
MDMRSGVSTRASRRSALSVVSTVRSGTFTTAAGGFFGGRALASASEASSSSRVSATSLSTRSPWANRPVGAVDRTDSVRSFLNSYRVMLATWPSALSSPILMMRVPPLAVGSLNQ